MGDCIALLRDLSNTYRRHYSSTQCKVSFMSCLVLLQSAYTTENTISSIETPRGRQGHGLEDYAKLRLACSPNIANRRH